MTQTAKRAVPSLGRQQRLMMSMMFDQGWWMAGLPWGVGNDSTTWRVCESLLLRGLLSHDGEDDDKYILTPAGYAWLIREAAADLAMLDRESEVTSKVADRIRHLAVCVQLSRTGPVNWRGERV